MVLAAVLVVLTAVGDLVGAVTAGVFSCVNTALLVYLNHQHRVVRRVLTAPRRLLYDQDGQPVGTVLDLRSEPDWLMQAGRRATDEGNIA